MVATRHIGICCGLVLVLTLGGCSLVFGADKYQGAGTHDSGEGDAARDAAADAMAPACTADVEGCVPVPSFVGEANWGRLYAEGTEDVRSAAGEVWQFDTATGEIKNGEVVVRALAATQDGVDATSGIGFVVVSQGNDAPGLGVFYVKSWTVEATAVVNVVGDNAFVLLASDDIEIDGTVDVGAHGSSAGPGGRDGVSTPEADSARHPEDGAAGEGISSRKDGGGGGGANGAAGGAGGVGRYEMVGEILVDAPAGLGGMPLTDDTSLRGGGGGGLGRTCVGACGTGSHRFRAGGGGGGAIQLASATHIRIGATGTVVASGDGGQVDASEDLTTIGTGAGGGAGGTVYLEAPSVEVGGKVTANGGGGGGADDDPSVRPASGERGHLSDDLPAVGSAAADNLSSGSKTPGAGGSGGAGKMSTQAGADGIAAGNDAAGGGGGGGVGRIIVRTGKSLKIGPNLLFSPRRSTSAFDEGSLAFGRLAP